MKISRIRSILYTSAKFLGDFNAVKRGKIQDRIVQRVSGKVTSRFNREVAKRARNIRK